MKKPFHPWEGYIKPFCIFGNLYFIGTHPASTHLIDTGDGLILMDPGYPLSLYLVLENMRALGFSPYDIKYIINTHGHYDHCGATRALAELTGAKTFLGAADLSFVNGETDLHLGAEKSDPAYCFMEIFTPDVLLRDGDHIVLGNTDILCKAAPGHTPGTMAFFFNVTDGKQTLRAAMHGGVGMNSMNKPFLEKHGLTTETRDQFVPAIMTFIDEPVDIHLGNHVGNNDTEGKAARITEAENPFIDPTAWKKFLLSCIEKWESMVQEEAE
ncbi:MAG: MBL fold metallo-hydrolase [Clostridia bacterium]|nr:MBL fold metallo-hydrolase [Clostridia bacterium]